MSGHGLLLSTFSISSFPFTRRLEITHFMLINENPESILIVWESTVESQGLLCFCQPLQEGVDHRVKFLCLTVNTHTQSKISDTPVSNIYRTVYTPPPGKKVFIMHNTPVKKRVVYDTAFYTSKERWNTSRKPTGRLVHHSCSFSFR